MTADLPPPSRKRQQTRERLMDAAYQLFATHGIHATPIEAIAEAAGFTRGAFYSNFDSKNELFFALAEREWATQISVIQQVMERHLTSPALTRDPIAQGVADLLLEVFSAAPDSRTWTLISREFELLALRDPQAASEYLTQQRSFQSELKDVLVGAVETLGRKFAIDPLELIEIVLLLHESAITRAILADAPNVEHYARDALLATIPSLMERLTDPA